MIRDAKTCVLVQRSFQVKAAELFLVCRECHRPIEYGTLYMFNLTRYIHESEVKAAAVGAHMCHACDADWNVVLWAKFFVHSKAYYREYGTLRSHAFSVKQFSILTPEQEAQLSRWWNREVPRLTHKGFAAE